MNLEIVALDTSTPQLLAPQAGDAYLAPRTLNITPEANTSALTASSYSVTGTGTTPMVDLSGAWSTTGTATLIKANLTGDTGPSNAASLLMDLQVGGSSKFSVTKGGAVTTGGTITFSANSFSLRQAAGTLTFWDASNSDVFQVASYGQGVCLSAASQYAWSSTTAPNYSQADLFLSRDAANTLAQRRTTNAQTFRIYNTYTDASNYERGKLQWDSNVLKIGTEKAGTGTARDLAFETPSGYYTFGKNITSAVSGHILEIYSSATNRSGFIFGQATLFEIGASSGVSMRFTASSNVQFITPRIQFNGATSSFPALKNTAAALNVRLADDSADANLTAAALTLSGNLTISTKDIVTDTTTGTKIGTGTTQKLAFWDATPIVQPTTGIAEAAFVENSGGTAVNVDSTFDGYTLQQIAKALRDAGLLA